MTNAILADVIDYDEFLNGARSEGAFSVFATLIPKFVSIPASAIPLAIVNMIGFQAPVNGVSIEQSKAVKSYIRLMFVLLPFISTILAIGIKLFYPLKTPEMVKMVEDGIKLHREGKPVGSHEDHNWEF